MLHILLLILKIIGIAILCILGILLLGIFCALFVPLRYRVEVTRREGEGEPPVVVEAKATWLLHFINVLLRFTGTLMLRARITFITVFRLPKKEKRRQKPEEEAGALPEGKGHKKQEKKAEESRKLRAEEAGRVADTQRAAAAEGEEAAEERKAAASEKKTESTVMTGESADSSTAEKAAGQVADGTEEIPEMAEKPSIWGRLQELIEKLLALIQKIKGLFENIEYTIQKFCDKIKSVSENIAYYRGIIEGKAFQDTFVLCKGGLMRICRALKPKKFEAKLVVGMDDPAVTGEILAVCGMLYPLLGGHVDIAGDFGKKRLEGRVFLQGKLRLFTFLRVALKLFFNRDIRKLYKLFKKEAV